MPQPFIHTTRALRDDSRGAWLGLTALTVVFCALWGGWAILTRVPIYATSSHARLVSKARPILVQAREAGALLEVELGVSQVVSQGQPLARLDARQRELELARQRALIKVIDDSELPALKRQIEIMTQMNAVGAQGAVSAANVKESQAQLNEALAQERQAQDLLKRQEKLLGAGAQSEVIVVTQRALVERLAQSVLRWRATLKRARGEGELSLRALEAQRAELERALGALERERAQLEANQRELEYALTRYVVSAPVSGVLTASKPYQVGELVAANEVIAVIVPSGEVILEATFEPRGLTGRIEPGQAARMRLDAFAWARYGELKLTVTEVAREPVEGRLRVLCTIDAMNKVNPQLLRHGLTGTLEITIEEVAPWALLLRQLGQRFDSPPSDDLKPR